MTQLVYVCPEITQGLNVPINFPLYHMVYVSAIVFCICKDVCVKGRYK